MMKKLSIFLILLFAIPYAAIANQFWYTGGGGGGGGSGQISDGTIEGQVPYWDNTGLTWTPMTGVIWEEANGSLVLGAGSATNPAFALADGTTGFYQPAPGNLYISVSGTTRWRSNATWIGSLYANGASLRNNGGSSTVPNVIVNTSDSDTGIGPGGLDALSLIAGGVSGVLITETAGLITVDVAGILTATDTTGPQFKAEFDALNYTTLETDSVGNFFIWPTGESVFIGSDSGELNTGIRSNGVGWQALYSNTGDTSNGVGWQALYSNTGVSGTGLGDHALFANSGIRSCGLGARALYSNDGDSCNAVGYFALHSNFGNNCNGLGGHALYSNLGIRCNGIGDDVMYANTGDLCDGFGYNSLYYNTGDESIGFGYETLRYNQSERAGAFGHSAWSTFLANVGGNKIFANTDVNIGTDRVTVAAHGFGATGDFVNLLYTEGTGPITPLVSGNVYQIKIVDASTIGFYEGGRGINITNAGTGTGHTLTPQFTYDNTIAIGNDASPMTADAIYFGGHAQAIVDMDLSVSGTVTVNGLIELKTSETVADDAFVDLPAGVSGWGTVSAGDNQEHTRFWFSSDGTVTLSDSTANVVNTDTDANLCVFDGGAVVRISNRLGAPLTLKISAEY